MQLTTIPQEDGFKTSLAQEYTGGLGDMFLQSSPNFTMPVGETCYAVLQANGADPFLVEFDSIDTGNNTINVTNVTLFKGASIANPTGITYPTNTEVLISDNFQFWSDIKDAINSKLDSNGGNTTTTWDLQISGSAFRIRLDAGDMKFTDDNNVEISLSTIAAASGADRKTAISPTDTTPDELDAKIITGDGLTKAIGTPAGDETLDLSIDLITTNGLKFTGDQLDIDPSGEGTKGTLEIATSAEIITATNDTKAVTPAKGLIGYGTVTPGTTNTYLSANTERTSSSDTYTKIKEFTVNKAGCYSILFDLKASIGGASNINAQIQINDIVVGIERTSSSTTYVTFSEDFEVLLGDKVQLFFRSNTGTDAIVRNYQMKYDLVAGVTDGVVDID